MADILRIPVGRDVADRVRWLTAQRWFALLFALAIVGAASVVLESALPVAGLLTTLALVALGNLACYLLCTRSAQGLGTQRAHRLMHAQIIGDILGLTAILHFAGGLENPFSVYYVLIVGMASILMSKRDAYAYAAGASAIWLALLLAEAAGILPHYNLTGFRLPVRYREAVHIGAESLVIATANVGVAYIGSSIMERLREGERQLYEANAACEFRAGQLRELNERLEELDRTRSLFIRLVTHELRAPVAAIKSYLRLILDGYVPDERLHEIIARSEQRAGEQLELIQDLLDLAHVQQPLDQQPALVDVAGVLGDVMELMEARISDEELDVSVDVERGEFYVMAQEDHIRQLWTNLVSNAVKYTPPGGRVTVSLRRADGDLRGTVQDTGIGIKPEELPRIFEDFYRTEAAKAVSAHGTGLGLSIVKGIAERYGGRVGVESEVGVGSTFTFELPLAVAARRAAPEGQRVSTD